MTKPKHAAWKEDNPSLKAYQRMEFLPSGTEPFELDKDGLPIVYYGEMFCRMPGRPKGTLCGAKSKECVSLGQHIRRSVKHGGIGISKQWKWSQTLDYQKAEDWFNDKAFHLLKDEEEEQKDSQPPRIHNHEAGAIEPDTGDDAMEDVKQETRVGHEELADTEIEAAATAEASLATISRSLNPSFARPSTATSPIRKGVSATDLADANPPVPLSTRNVSHPVSLAPDGNKRGASAAYGEQINVTTKLEETDNEDTRGERASIEHDSMEGDDALAEQLHVDAREVELAEARLRLAKTKRDMAMRKRQRRG